MFRDLISGSRKVYYNIYVKQINVFQRNTELFSLIYNE